MSELPTAARCAQARSPARRGHRVTLPALLAGALLSFGVAIPLAHAAEPSHGISVFGDLKYGPDFEHFDYASPEAVKGGSVTLATLGSYDNLNPFILKGQAAAAAGGIYDTLTVNSLDEPFSVYGLLAESIEIPEDKSSVTFRLRPEARWHDGEPLTAEDVVWTFETLTTEGHPLYRTYYADVENAEALDERTVRFTFAASDNAELPLIMGQLPVLPKHFWEDREFTETTLEPLLGSGPYRFGKIEPGRSISYERVEDYWGKGSSGQGSGRTTSTPSATTTTRDTSVGLEALKSGDIDFRRESIAKNWATGYDFPAIEDGAGDRGRAARRKLPADAGDHLQSQEAEIPGCAGA